jgi:excisionase family DNA binding protein
MSPAKLSYTLKEAAQSTGLSQRFLCYAIADGRLKSVKVGGRRLILARHLEDFIVHGGKTAENPAPVPLNQER